jgi:hypothetical protein
VTTASHAELVTGQCRMDVTLLRAQAAAAFDSGSFRVALQLTQAALDQLASSDTGVLQASASAAPTVKELASPAAATAPEAARLRSNLAAAHLELREYAQAAHEAHRAIQLHPSWHRPYLRLCTALASQRRTAAAVEVLRQGLAAVTEPSQRQELLDAMQLLQEEGPPLRRPAEQGDEPSSSGRGVERQSRPAAKRPRRDAEADPQPASPAQPLPVLALSGFLGAGKTTLVGRISAWTRCFSAQQACTISCKP